MKKGMALLNHCTKYKCGLFTCITDLHVEPVTITSTRDTSTNDKGITTRLSVIPVTSYMTVTPTARYTASLHSHQKTQSSYLPVSSIIIITSSPFPSESVFPEMETVFNNSKAVLKNIGMRK